MPKESILTLINQEALDYFKAKKLARGFDYRDIWLHEHAVAFTVAKMMDKDLLAETQAALTSALNNGTDFRVFKKRLKPYLMSKGWWGMQGMTDPQTGKARLVQLGSTRRLRTIYHTNMRVAHAAGKWQRIQRDKQALPFLKYIGSTASNKRDEHKQFANLILPVDDPFWATHYPPNGYGCKCGVRQLTPKQAQREGGVSASPKLKMVEYTNKRTGEVSLTPAGIHPSFAHNHGDRLGALDWLFGDKHGADAVEQLIAQREAYLSSVVTEPLNIGVVALPNLAPKKEVARLAVDALDGVKKPSEGLAAAQWQIAHNQRLERYDLANNPNPPDYFIIESGVERDQLTTIDFMYTMDGDNQFKIDKFNRYIALTDRFWQATKSQIQRHLVKADIVPLDMRHLNALNRDKIINYVLSLPQSQQDKIRFLVRESK